MAELPLYPVSRLHLAEMSDQMGVWQHATGAWPNRAFGYCTDDVARALVVDLAHARVIGWTAVEADAHRSMRFLEDAFNSSLGRFRNFRSAEGEWLDEAGSEDSHARALEALGEVIANAPDNGLVDRAARLFDRALPAAGSMTELRPMAAALLGCEAAIEGGADGAAGGARATLVRLAARLDAAFTDLPGEWPWPVPIVTYENALLPRALIAAGVRLEDEAMLDRGCRTLDWLIAAQVGESGRLSLIGNNGWLPRHGPRAQFDQQPIDATALLLAAQAAYEATGRDSYRQVAEIAYGWFLGENDAKIVVAIPATGGCHDGLCADGVNLNQGAESTLMWLMALEHLRRLRTMPQPVAEKAAVRSQRR
jgi:hypothetical protein